MKVLVVGGSQFNGLALVKELVKHGHDVSVVNRGKSRGPALPRAVRSLVCDRTDHAKLREVIGREDWDCVQDMCAYHPEDVESIVDILHGRVGHYVFASSTVIYAPTRILPITEHHPVDRGPAQNEYGLHKILCEDFLLRRFRETGFPVTIAAFSMVFGPNNIIPEREQKMFVRMHSGRKILIPGDGTTVGQIGHVEDEARALRALMQKNATFGKRYNLTGPDYFTDEGYVDTFARVVGVEPEKVFVPPEVMDDLWDGKIEVQVKRVESNIDIRSSQQNSAQMQKFLISNLLQRIAPNLHRWNASNFFSIEALKRDAGWEPEINFEAAVEHTWEWMQREGLHESLDFDFTLEDQLLERLGH